MPKPDTDMLRGTLDMLILKVVDIEPMHGWGISTRESRSRLLRTAVAAT